MQAKMISTVTIFTIILYKLVYTRTWALGFLPFCWDQKSKKTGGNWEACSIAAGCGLVMWVCLETVLRHKLVMCKLSSYRCVESISSQPVNHAWSRLNHALSHLNHAHSRLGFARSSQQNWFCQDAHDATVQFWCPHLYCKRLELRRHCFCYFCMCADSFTIITIQCIIIIINKTNCTW